MNPTTLNFSTAVEVIQASIDANDMTPILLLGRPGCGKTAVCTEVNRRLGIPSDVTDKLIFRPSLRDPTDLLGLPAVERDEDGQLVTRWSLNSYIRYVNDVASQYSHVVMPIDEIGQAVPMMQNALAGLVYDGFVGENYLAPNVLPVLTGNRVEDKAGSGRILSQLGNRVESHTMGTDLDGWASRMIHLGYDPMIVAYVRFDPAALEDFDPDRIVNGTMRSWEAAAKVDSSLPLPVYRAKLCGRIPEGRVAQFLAFRELFNELPSAEQMCNSPMTAHLPVHNRGAMYAAASLAYKRANDKTFANLTKYVGRIAVEGGQVDVEASFYKDIAVNKPELTETKEFGDWINTRGASVML